VTGSVNRLHPELATLTRPLALPRRRRAGRKLVLSWIVFILGVVYFALPLIGTLLYSLKDRPTFKAYTDTLADAQLYKALGYSFLVAIITVVLSVVLLVPTAFWVRLRLPRLRPIIEFVTLLPFVVPPIVLVYGLLTTFNHPPLPLTTSNFGSDLLLTCAYVVLSFPYMYRAIDTGLRVIDIRSLTEAGQSLGAGWFTILFRIILPNLRVAILSGAFLTLAIVVGEFTIANFLARPMFAVYLQLIFGNKAYEPAAVALFSFAITWAAMGVIALIGRGGGRRVELVGAH
jgi:putative spermidine/putrescine transport system permease protein